MTTNQRRSFGATGREVSVVGQGTWNMEKRDRARAVAALRGGLDLGMTHIDTAEMYGSGDTEEIVGEAIRGRRDEVFLVSKVLPQNASREGVVAACERSLQRLGTDRLDCYLLHWPGNEPLAETFGGFNDLMGGGKILSWGVSNFDEDDLRDAVAVAGEGAIACNQVLYHLGERAIEHSVLPFCQKHEIAIVGYSPFGQGDFPGSSSAGGRVLADVASAHQTTARRVALAFLTRAPGTFTIPKASDLNHMADNAGAAQTVLTPDEIQAIEAAFPAGRRRRLPTL